MSRFRVDWSRKDDRLRTLYLAGTGKRAIAEILGVSYGAVAARLRKLGITR